MTSAVVKAQDGSLLTHELVDDGFRRKLTWLVVFRGIVVLFLVAGTILLGGRPGESGIGSQGALYGLALIMGLLSLGYAWGIRRFSTPQSLRLQAYIQLLGDTIFSSSMVLLTGGTASAFTFFYSLSIINAAVLLYRRGAFVIATSSSLVFIILGLMELGWIPKLGMHEADIFYGIVWHLEGQKNSILWNLANNIFAFYTVGFLASRLSEQLRSSEIGRRMQTGSFRDLKALHENIIGSVGTGLITVNADGEITLVNPAANELLEWNSEQVFLGDLLTLLPELEPLVRPESDASSHELETVRAHADGEQHIRWSRSPLTDGRGGSIGYVIAFQDITHLRQMEQEVKRAEQLATVGRLAASIAHEIRNPLTAISGAVQVLRDSTPLEASDARLLQIVGQEADALNKWITDFLMYARPRDGERVPINLTKVVRDALEMLSHGEDMARIVTHLNLVDPMMVRADPTYIEQLIWNVVMNAVQAMPDGGELFVAVRPGDSEGSCVSFSVRDTGIGIAKEVLDRVFEPFFTTKNTGTGLGLATVERLVREHGGTSHISSKVGEGTTFVITLPAAD